MEKTYTKLSNLVGDKFTIKKVYGYKWKKWDNNEKKMLVSDSYQEGYRKMYEIETDKGFMDLGSGQLGSLLESVFISGLADINLRTFEVKSNGKSGMDIRYFFNPVKEQDYIQEVAEEISEEGDPGDIPF